MLPTQKYITKVFLRSIAHSSVNRLAEEADIADQMRQWLPDQARGLHLCRLLTCSPHIPLLPRAYINEHPIDPSGFLRSSSIHLLLRGQTDIQISTWCMLLLFISSHSPYVSYLLYSGLHLADIHASHYRITSRRSRPS